MSEFAFWGLSMGGPCRRVCLYCQLNSRNQAEMYQKMQEKWCRTVARRPPADELECCRSSARRLLAPTPLSAILFVYDHWAVYHPKRSSVSERTLDDMHSDLQMELGSCQDLFTRHMRASLLGDMEAYGRHWNSWQTNTHCLRCPQLYTYCVRYNYHHWMKKRAMKSKTLDK